MKLVRGGGGPGRARGLRRLFWSPTCGAALGGDGAGADATSPGFASHYPRHKDRYGSTRVFYYLSKVSYCVNKFIVLKIN